MQHFLQPGSEAGKKQKATSLFVPPRIRCARFGPDKRRCSQKEEESARRWREERGRGGRILRLCSAESETDRARATRRKLRRKEEGERAEGGRAQLPPPLCAHRCVYRPTHVRYRGTVRSYTRATTELLRCPVCCPGLTRWLRGHDVRCDSRGEGGAREPVRAPYAPASPCPVLTSRSILCICYTVPDTDTLYHAMPPLAHVRY